MLNSTINHEKIMTIDRTISPDFKTVDKIEMIQAGKTTLRNNIPVYSINAGTQEVIKIEFMFSAGMYQQVIPLQATATNAIDRKSVV